VLNARERARRVPPGEPRSTRPKYASASAGSMSHNGRPSQVLTCSKCPTSPRIVPFVSPAEARASTHPASTSVPSHSKVRTDPTWATTLVRALLVLTNREVSR
jgi:hypothetical protein